MIIVSIALVGTASALACLWRRRWVDSALTILAAAALAAIAGGFTVPGVGGKLVAIDSDAVAPPAIADAAGVMLTGDGLRAAQWQDLPARPLRWAPPAADLLRLEFPRQVTLGRLFTLTVHRTRPAAGSLQLLAENDQLIAQASGAGTALSVQWLPPVAETLVLKARLLDGAGKLLAQGPIPLSVREAAPLQVQGRFAAPSFDVRALNELLTGSKALLDWQVTLGKTVTRGETARAPMAAPELVVVDAAWFERQHEAARGALLAQVADGATLLVLAANASDPKLWSRAMQLDLAPQPEKTTDAPLAMPLAPFNPATPQTGPWSAAGPTLWSRDWQKGRIAWLGVAGWHRYAISEPRALGQWWQSVLDQAGVRRSADVMWEQPQGMPLPGERLAICAQGVSGDAVFPDLKQRAAWQRRPDKADASCAAVWPRESGWLKVATEGEHPQRHEIYVYAKDDWPLWQRAQRRDATAQYAARTPQPETERATPLPAWPFAVVFALAMLGLWWRERR